MSWRGTRNGKRLRRTRRRPFMYPAEATEVSKRSRLPYPVTKNITRFHRRERYWKKDWNEDDDS